jgi:prepilin peptidase CpaA
MPIDAYRDVGVAVLVLAAAGRDLLDRTIPNTYLQAALACAALLHLAAGGVAQLLGTGVAGLAVGLGMLLPFYAVRRGMAAGDVKLMGAVGAFLGPLPACYACLASCLVGGGVALVLVQWRGTRAGTMAYAPVIAAGTLLTLIFQRPY